MRTIGHAKLVGAASAVLVAACNAIVGIEDVPPAPDASVLEAGPDSDSGGLASSSGSGSAVAMDASSGGSGSSSGSGSGAGSSGTGNSSSGGDSGPSSASGTSSGSGSGAGSSSGTASGSSGNGGSSSASSSGSGSASGSGSSSGASSGGPHDAGAPPDASVPACAAAYNQANCVAYVTGSTVSSGSHNWSCSASNCANCAADAACAPGQSGCPWGTVWTDEGACSACGPLNTVTNCGACGVACPAAGDAASVSSSTCTGTTCQYTCNAGHLDCNASVAPDTDGCECAWSGPITPVCCSGNACPTAHVTGYATAPSGASQTFYDCETSVDEQLAMDACTAYSGKAANCAVGNCNTTSNLVICNFNAPSQDSVCWGYGGAAAGYAVDVGTQLWSCPTGGAAGEVKYH